MIGILKAGLAFVPLDPEFPADRLEYIVDHAGIPLIICDDRYATLYSGVSPGSVRIVKPSHFDNEPRVENPDCDLPSDLLAYVMYTSGSTGKPKGVQIEHGSLITYCLADMELYRLKNLIAPSNSQHSISMLPLKRFIRHCWSVAPFVVRPRERAAASIELSHLVETSRSRLCISQRRTGTNGSI